MLCLAERDHFPGPVTPQDLSSMGTSTHGPPDSPCPFPQPRSSAAPICFLPLIRQRELHLWVLCLHFRFEICLQDAWIEGKILALQSWEQLAWQLDVAGGSGRPSRDRRVRCQPWPHSCWKQIIVGKGLWMGKKLYVMPTLSDLPRKITAARKPCRAVLAPRSEVCEFGQSTVSWRAAKHAATSIWIGKERCAVTPVPLQQRAPTGRS